MITELYQVLHEKMVACKLQERQRKTIQRDRHQRLQNHLPSPLRMPQGVPSPKQSPLDHEAAPPAPRRHHLMNDGFIAPDEFMSRVHHSPKKILVATTGSELGSENRADALENPPLEQNIASPAF